MRHEPLRVPPRPAPPPAWGLAVVFLLALAAIGLALLLVQAAAGLAEPGGWETVWG